MDQSSDFDFEEWAVLAKTDPEAFEAKRQMEIEKLIASASPSTQTRLRGLQWQIDAERRRAGTPLSACVRVFNQMWESVYGEGGLLDALNSMEGDPLPERPTADVLEFQPRPADQRNSKLSRSTTHF